MHGNLTRRILGNDTQEMDYLSSLISKWMPGQAKVAVDSHPRLSGIMDTVNSTLAHGPETRLPPAFYDKKARDIVDKIGVEEWFDGFRESKEYREVGIGPLAGDIVARMVGNVEQSGNDGLLEVGGETTELGKGRGGETALKLGLSGCHDTTLAALLSSLGSFEGQPWPPYTSHVAFELFKDAKDAGTGSSEARLDTPATASAAGKQNRFGKYLPFQGSTKFTGTVSTESMSRKPITDFTSEEGEKLKGHYVRVRFNDHPVTIPGCKTAGNHLEGDETFCTLVSGLSLKLAILTENIAGSI